MFTRHRYLSLASLCLLAACGDGATTERVPPPIILITLDTVRADCLGAYLGAPLGEGSGDSGVATPHLDAFAGGADQYETVTSAAPWTMPTHASLFTGLYPFEHGAHSFLPPEGARGDNVFALHERFETLAEALAARGYRTGGVVANAVYLRPMLGLEQGFAAWDVERSMASGVNERALRWLDENAVGRRPTFLFLNYMDAHRPYHTGDREDRPAEQLDQLLHRVMELGQESQELGQTVRGLHRKAVTRLDLELGRLFEGLRERGLFERSLIVITSDHGEAFGAHGIVEHSKDVYEDTVRVPLLVKLPGQVAGRVIETRTSSVHVPGLIAEALVGTDAESMAAVFPRVPGRGDRTVLAENYYSRIKDLERFGDRFKRRRWAFYEGDLKLIAGSDNSVELYDVSADSHETQDLAEARPSDAARLLRRLQATLMGPMAYQGSPVLPGAPMTEEQRSDAAALGYGGDRDEEESDGASEDSRSEVPR